MSSHHEIVDVTDGLWLWRTNHPAWTADSAWPRAVNSTCVAIGREGLLLDPLAPPPDCADVWARIDAAPPTIR